MTPGPSGETALLEDPRCGFSLALPGRPTLEDPTAELPAHQARLLITDLGVHLRYRLDEVPMSPPQLGPIAIAFAQAYGINRSTGPVRVGSAEPAKVAVWGGGAFAASIYPLRVPDDGCDTEEVVVAMRAAPGGKSWAVYLTKRFASATMSPLDWTSFNSAVTGSLAWYPEAASRAVPQVWPDSAVVEDGLPLRLKPAWSERVAPAAEALGKVANPAELLELSNKLARLGAGGEPPTTAMTDERRQIYLDFIATASPNEALTRAVTQLFDGLTSAHDLRGWVLFVQRVCRHPLS